MYYNFKTEESGAKAYYLGEYASGAQIDVASKYPDYAGLSADNFIIQPTALSIYTQNIKGYTHHFDTERDWCEISCAGRATLSAPSKSYNSSTGQLSFTLTLSEWCGSGVWDDIDDCQKSTSGAVTAKVYLVTGIESI